MNALQKSEPADNGRMMAMIERMVTDPAVDPGKLREILAVKQSWEADEARKMFATDMADFQARCPIIAKLDSANGKNYARIDRIHRETKPLRSECGFWFTWNSCEIKGEVAHIEGMLGHRGGHTVICKQVIPLPDEIISRDGRKVGNSAQRAGSAMTYAKRYGECLALGIVTGDDDDGNAKPKPNVPPPQGSDVAALKKQLWDMTAKIHNGNKNALRQFLVDDCGLDPEKPMEELSSKELTALMFVVKGKV